MTRLLVLTRHAKSDWSREDLSDHARPLNNRGRAAAPLVGQALSERGILPDQILCSSAMRTRQTWDGIAGAMAATPEAEYRDGLYHAMPETMLDLLRTATGQMVVVIGHNPGIAALASQLVTTRPDHPRFAHFPTGATLIAEVDEWATLAYDSARPVDFFVPRDLSEHP